MVWKLGSLTKLSEIDTEHSLLRHLIIDGCLIKAILLVLTFIKLGLERSLNFFKANNTEIGVYIFRFFLFLTECQFTSRESGSGVKAPLNESSVSSKFLLWHKTLKKKNKFENFSYGI